MKVRTKAKVWTVLAINVKVSVIMEVSRGRNVEEEQDKIKIEDAVIQRTTSMVTQNDLVNPDVCDLVAKIMGSMVKSVMDSGVAMFESFLKTRMSGR